MKSHKFDLSLFKTRTMKLNIKKKDLFDKYITLLTMEYKERTEVLAKELFDRNDYT